MAHESMVRNLASQAEAIWPQERPLIERYDLPSSPRIVDVGCGPGEMVTRLAALFPDARILGIDINADHLERARVRCASFGDRISFRRGDALSLDLPEDESDLALCRHLLQALPTPERVVAELARVTRPGGVVHLVAEDYGMMHFHPVTEDTDRFWRDGPMTFAERTGTDLRQGRKAFTAMRHAGLVDVRVDYVVIDTVRVPRETFASIWTAWRDGYAAAIAQFTEISHDDVIAAFETMTAAIRDPDGYAVWQLPVVSGRVP